MGYYEHIEAFLCEIKKIKKVVNMEKYYFTGEFVSSDRMLYTPSEFARSNLMHLQEIGSLQAKKTHTSKRQNLDSFLFFYVKEGEGILPRPLPAGQHLQRQACVMIDVTIGKKTVPFFPSGKPFHYIP